MPKMTQSNFKQLLNNSVDIFVDNNFKKLKNKEIDQMKKFFKGDVKLTLIDYYQNETNIEYKSVSDKENIESIYNEETTKVNDFIKEFSEELNNENKKQLNI